MRKALLVAVLAASALPAFAQGVLEVSGATTVQRRILEPGGEAFKAATGVQLKVYGPGTGKGMLALVEGKVPVAAAGESLEDAVESAKAAATEVGRPITIPPNLVYSQVASDNIVVAVHPSNPVKQLTKAQLKDIMTGKVRNWSEVGGPSLPIKAYAAAQGQAVRTLVQKSLMDGENYAPTVADIRTAVEQLKVVAGDPAGVAAMSEPVIKAGPEKLRIVPGAVVPRPLGFVTVGAPTGPALKLVEYFRSPEGQKQIR